MAAGFKAISSDIESTIRARLARDDWFLRAILVIDIVAHTLAYLFLSNRLLRSGFLDPIIASLLPFLFLWSAVLSMGLVAQWRSRRTSRQAADLLQGELSALQWATHRLQVLETMAATLRTTLNLEAVMETAVDACVRTLQELGASNGDVIAAVYLFHHDALYPIIRRHLATGEGEKPLAGRKGIVATAMREAEIIMSHVPAEDPELAEMASFRHCRQVVCIPLRAGFQWFGVILLGTRAPVEIHPAQTALFRSVADQAVIALQNAMLDQALEAEKKRMAAADQEARKELARALHDGLAQTVAAIAMRVNVARSLMSRDPNQALAELKEVEEMARATSKEIRRLLFNMRPLALESQGLAAAIEMSLKQLGSEKGPKMRLVGGPAGDLLGERAQATVFQILEEALTNAHKHASASLIEVSLWRDGDLFVARVSDDGVGFDADQVLASYSRRTSLGLLNMRERAEMINGSVQMTSEPGQGTSVTLVVPLDKQGRREPISAS